MKWLLSFFFSAPVMANVYPITSMWVIDGDTVHAEINLGLGVFLQKSIRLAGVDTPELTKNPEPAKRAKKFTSDFVLVSACTITNPKWDKYGRVLADIVCDGKSLSEALIKGGFGRSYSGGKR